MDQKIMDKYFPGLIVPDSQKEEFETKLRLKGIERYSNLYKAIAGKTDSRITYRILSEHYRYDIKLRRALHKIIAFTEVAMRATICNKFKDVEIEQKTWKKQISKTFHHNYTPNESVYRKIVFFFNNFGKEKNTLFDLLENCDLQVLNSIFLLLDENLQKVIFKSDFEHLSDNLDALRELRNCTEHHQLLIIKELKEVWNNGEKQRGLKSNIENAINLSPEMAKSNLKKLINDCLIIDEKQERSEENTYQLLPAFKVYFED